MTISLEVTSGAMNGKVFKFEEHDNFIFGRSKDAHCRITGDPAVSRFHFILELNPPFARIRDLGSTNGTGVNRKRYGGKKAGGGMPSFEANLEDGAIIKVGRTSFHLLIESSETCVTCNAIIPENQLRASKWIGGQYLCRTCREEAEKRKESDFHNLDHPASHEEASPNRANLDSASTSGAEPCIDIPGYEISDLLGQGGMGLVYLGRHIRSGKEVAVFKRFN